ncbi:MAG TPA: hypothetical protein VMB21_01430 [Candidatus Limnocylindria bacterium]|jgi:hypothetical protein|nr:hypothetical protein [Candidatus Limnocylindria bacterium]
MNVSDHSLENFFSSVSGMAVLVLLTILAVGWILFPLIAWSYFGKLHAELKRLNEQVTLIKRDTVQIEVNTRESTARAE